MLIVCEGAITEPQYLLGFTRACRNPRVRIEVSDEHGDPKFLVETAKQRKKQAEEDAAREHDDNLAFDSVWCVCDVDDHHRLTDAKHMARDNEIDLAVSNPCFELWLLLHFRDSPGMQHRDKIRAMLRAEVPDYDKHVDYPKYAAGYPQAVTRAARMDESAERDGEAGRNPSTGVYKLTEVIRGQ